MQKNLPDLSFNFDQKLPVEMIPWEIEKLARAGAERLMLDSALLMQSATDPLCLKTLQKALSDNGMTLFDAHAPYEPMDSFGYPAEETDQYFFDTAFRALNAGKELGVRTMTFHCARTRRVGSMVDQYGVFETADLEKARSRIMFQLDKILPEAEKLEIVIALENLFLPSTTASFLHSISKEFSHPYLGLNYDSGHALLLEKQPGKKSEDIAGWIRCGWDDDTVVFQDDQLDIMLDQVVTAHLHDNHGCNDEHLMPGEGIADWKKIIERLRRAPRLLSLQSEVVSKYFGDEPQAQIIAFRNCGFEI